MNERLIILLSIIITISIFSYPNLINGNANGSPGGKTNSPADGQNCTSCHNGTINTGIGSISITSDIPNSGYIPGETYTITTNIIENGSNKFGFELTAEGGSGFNPKIGEWIITDVNLTKKVNNDGAVTHKGSGNSGSGSKSWSVDWQAPLWGMSTGTINFYVSGLAANNNGNNSGDQVYTHQYTVNEQQSNGIENKINIYQASYSNNNINIPHFRHLKAINIYDIHGKIINSFKSEIPEFISTNEFNKGTYIIQFTNMLNKQYSNKINIY